MAKNPKKILQHFEHTALSNASKTLLANIRFASVDDRVKTIVVTSSGQNEGKTIVSTNLANAIATSGKKVLIVEADMRRRSLGTLLNLHPANGLYAVLSGAAKLNEAVLPTHIPNLYFMDAEPNIPSPPDILSTKRFASLVDKLRDSFDYVIFDTPPVSLFVDAAILGSLVDGTLFVVRQNQTKRALAAKCAQQLRVADARILGTVVTFCSDDESSYYYAYYTQDGKRVKKEDFEPAAMPVELNNASDIPWDQTPRVTSHRPRQENGRGGAGGTGGTGATPGANPSAGVGGAGRNSGNFGNAGGSYAAGGSHGTSAAQGGQSGVNPYAPNAFKAVTTGASKGRHKNGRL